MPDIVITMVAIQGSARTLGSKNHRTGSAATPRKAVNTIRTVGSLSWKYLSTRNLSMWVETAQKSGPEKVYRSPISSLAPAQIDVGRAQLSLPLAQARGVRHSN